MSSDVKLSGPLFDGRAAKAAASGVDEIRDRLAQSASRLAEAALAGSIRREGDGRAVRSVTTTRETTAYQTGRYVMPVVVDRATDTVVTTDLATYGPWLEGTGSRNLTSRFRGYHSFRKAAQELDGSAGFIADSILEPYVEDMR